MKEKIITFGFIFVLLIVFVSNIIKKDEKISIAERRNLAQFPKITLENLAEGKVSEDFDKYSVDQFIFRDTFRNIKELWNEYIYKQKDNDGLFLIDDKIYKIEYPIKESNVQKSADKIKNICDNLLNDNMKIYYSIIPDKNFYLSNEYLKIDVNQMYNIMNNTLRDAQYIDITNDLGLEDYYRTDHHWKQENLIKVVNEIEDKMNLEKSYIEEYELKELTNFYGTYYGQLGKKLEPDKLNILTSETIKNASTFNIETNKNEEVYNMEKLQTSTDKYDIFLSGPTSIITIENPNGPKGKELILFRDSYGSSIAPLLLKNYEKITLIDLRYVSSRILNNYINFENQDVLFLYNTLVLNQNLLK